MERSVVQGLAVFRWAAWVWLGLVLVVTRSQLARPAVAVAAAGAALVVTAAATAYGHADRAASLRTPAVVAELTVGLALLVLDGVVAGHGEAFATRQSLGSVWPLAGVLAAGVAWGKVGGGVAGAVIGSGRILAVLVNGAALDRSGRVLSLVTTVVFYALAGAVAGHLYALLRAAERDISAARAREEVARTLHDGVLQTLALVERRAGDPALARLARDQERELRQFLFGVGRGAGAAVAHTTPDLAAALRTLAGRFESAYGGRADVIVADDVPSPSPEASAALTGAVGELLANAGKHGGESVHVTVYVEPSDEPGSSLTCSVTDDGPGFDVAATEEGVGLRRSVRGRLDEVGGRVELTSRPGSGTEVRLWL